MNICVYGIGGIGGSIGGLLCNYSRTNKDVHVYFIARGDHLNSIRDYGLQLQLPDNQILCNHPTGAHSSITEIPTPDVIFLCVKSYDLPDAISDISHIINSEMIIIPLLNGFDIYERIRNIVKKGLIFPACIYLGGRKISAGKCALFPPPGMLFFGADPMRIDYTPSKLISLLSDAFDKSYLKIMWQQNPYPAIWQKYMFNVAVNLMNAYSGKVLGEILEDTVLRQMTKNILSETAEIVQKIGAPIAPNAENLVWGLIEKLPFTTKSSYAVDIENMKKNEGEIFGTAIIELGKKTSVHTKTIENVFYEIERKLEKRKADADLNM
jgi:2-dehydropantoate 2-reductase